MDTVGTIFDQKEAENPGRIYGLPKESIFLGIEEEVNAMLAAQAPKLSSSSNTTTNGASGPAGPSGAPNGVVQNGYGGGIARTNGSFTISSGHKGKERARNDAMDIG